MSMKLKPRLLALFAHPDDETFRAGGTLALLARRGFRIQTLTATRGQAGSCGEPQLCSPADLPAVREVELRCACKALGIEPPIILDYQDGHLAKANRDAILADILAAVDKVRPSVLLSFGLDGLSGHPDHIALANYTFEIYRDTPAIQAIYTMAVPESLAVALKMDQIQALPDEQITLVLDVSQAWDAKMAAIRCHATQLSSTPILGKPLEQQRLFLGKEYFVKRAARSKSDFFENFGAYYDSGSASQAADGPEAEIRSQSGSAIERLRRKK